MNHPNRLRTLLVAASALALALLPTRSLAVGNPITWGTPQLISADIDVSTSGSLLYAYTFGAVAVPSATVNGVTFSSFAITNGSSVNVGNVTLADPVNGTMDPSNTAFGAGSGTFAGLSSSYQALLQSGVSNTTFHGTMTLNLAGLTNGQSYQVEIWANESGSTFDNTPSHDANTIFTSVQAATLDLTNTNAPGGVGQWVTGTFSAVGSSQNISISANNYPDLNAVQVRAVPEPGSALLLALGAGALLGRRRRAAVGG